MSVIFLGSIILIIHPPSNYSSQDTATMQSQMESVASLRHAYMVAKDIQDREQERERRKKRKTAKLFQKMKGEKKYIGVDDSLANTSIINSFQARIWQDGKSKYLGSFNTPEEAAREFDRAAIPLGRPYNFPLLDGSDESQQPPPLSPPPTEPCWIVMVASSSQLSTRKVVGDPEGYKSRSDIPPQFKTESFKIFRLSQYGAERNGREEYGGDDETKERKNKNAKKLKKKNLLKNLRGGKGFYRGNGRDYGHSKKLLPRAEELKRRASKIMETSKSKRQRSSNSNRNK